MPGQLLRLSDRLLNTQLLIHPAKAQIILGALSGRIGIDADLFSLDETVESGGFCEVARRDRHNTHRARPH